MSNKKRPSSKKMRDYENEKIEVAKEIGVIDPTDAEVNTKIAAQDDEVNRESIAKRHKVTDRIQPLGRKSL